MWHRDRLVLGKERLGAARQRQPNQLVDPGRRHWPLAVLASPHGASRAPYRITFAAPSDPLSGTSTTWKRLDLIDHLNADHGLPVTTFMMTAVAP